MTSPNGWRERRSFGTHFGLRIPVSSPSALSLQTAAHMTVMTSPSRKPSGSPAGGRFTHKVHGDGEVVLRPADEFSLDRRDWPLIAFAATHRELDPTAESVTSAEDDRRTLALLADFEDRLVSQGRAESLTWNALADTWEVPFAVSNLVPLSVAAAHEYAIIHNGGGVVSVCDRFRLDAQSERESEALFSPFDTKRGYLTDIRREAIVSALERVPQISDRLWRGALRYSTQR